MAPRENTALTQKTSKETEFVTTCCGVVFDAVLKAREH